MLLVKAIAQRLGQKYVNITFPVCTNYLRLTSQQKTHLKRAREDDDLDLDGEERLRLGKSLKKRTAEHTPRWKNSRKTREQGGVPIVRAISLEQAERLRLRRQLANAEKHKAIEEMERVMQEADNANDLW